MDKLYIDAVIDDATNVLRIFTTAEFANFEEEQTVDEIALSLELTCTTGTQRLLFRQRITESNNHDPVFNQSVYEFEVQLPLPMGFDLTFFQVFCSLQNIMSQIAFIILVFFQISGNLGERH